MRRFMLVMAVAGCALGQAMTEFGAAAAGSTAGAAGGKKLSDGITAVMGKLGGTLDKAADPAMKVAPGVVKERSVLQGSAAPDPSGVPAPPSPSFRPAADPKPPVVTQAQVELPEQVREFAEPLPQLQPPPQMRREDLALISPGASRADLLKYGAPSSKLSMFEGGSLVETYSYRENGQKIGTVRLKDGTVASVQ